MAIGREKFRTNQEEYFEPEDEHEGASGTANGNAKFIAVVVIGFLAAASLGTFLSFAR